MLIQIGELARRAGITVRTLHHYESQGLLLPSARTDAGYRLYNARDVERLHTIQALIHMGLSLAEVRACLENHSVALTDIIDQQIAMLNSQISRFSRLRERLEALQSDLKAGQEPNLSEWLTTLELMKMYDRWFSNAELDSLPFARKDPAREKEWQQLVQQVKQLMKQEIPPEQPQAQRLATRWMEMLERDTAGKPDFLTRLNEMHAKEMQMQAQTGITSEVQAYVTRAFAESKLAIYQRYLSPDEYSYTRAHYFDRMMEWPPLVAKLHAAQTKGIDPASQEAKALAAHWLELFTAFAGKNPQTHQKFREAMRREPALASGTWMTPAVLGWLQQAVGALMQSDATAR